MEVQTNADIKTRLVGVLWGDAKVGKTTYAMSLPGKKLLINFDPDGYLSVANRTDFDLIDLSEMTALDAGNQATKIGDYIMANKDKYQSVIVDSLTTLVEMSLNYAIQKGVGKSQTFTPSILAPGLSAYGGRNNVFNDVISRVLRATSLTHMHVFMIAHNADALLDEKGNQISQTIMLPDKARNMTALKASEIWHINQSRSGRTIYVKPFGIKSPMGSRIINTDKLHSFVLEYDPSLPDKDQPHSLANIYQTWIDGDKQKLVTL